MFYFDFLMTILPLALLIGLMTKHKSMSANQALPLTALISYGLMILYFKTDLFLVHAAVIDGLLTAFTPIVIIMGAVLLFKTMEYTGVLKHMSQILNGITTNKVAQVMIIAWSFSFLIEGVSGFGTPAALAAPLLVGLGFPPIRVAIVCLIMNSVPVTFGAVGMPTWFGFSGIMLSQQELLHVGVTSAILQTTAALFIPLVALKVIVTAQEIRKSIVFIMLSVLASAIPFLLTALVNGEFPTIIGGFVGLILSISMARLGIGLPKESGTQTKQNVSIGRESVIKTFFPLWATVLVLMMTRVPFLGIKKWLLDDGTMWHISLGHLGVLDISAALVIQLKNILGTGVQWKHALLYVPSFIPFVLISMITMLLFRVSKQVVYQTWRETFVRILNPALALFGAMVFVKLMMVGGDNSRAVFIGQTLGNAVGTYWQYLAVFLGALGTFFSGSNTVSNLVFGPVQDALAVSTKLDRIIILSLQSVGGAMGGMVCLHNIVAVSSILSLEKQEGYILKQTIFPMLLYGMIVTVAAVIMSVFL